MQAVLYMSVAILAFSIYPLIMIYGSPMGVSLFLLTALTCSTIIAFVVQSFYLRNNHDAQTALKEYFVKATFDDYIFIAVTGITTVLTHVFFIVSLGMMSEVGASIIYESWPIFSMFLAPLIIRKVWKHKLTLLDYVGACIAMGGIVLISLSEQSTLSDEQGSDTKSILELIYSLDIYTLIGGIVALMGGIMLALFVNYRTELSNRLQKSSPALNDSMLVSVIGEFICRAASLPFLIIAILFMPDEGTTTTTTLLAAFIFGAFTLFIGNIAFTMAMLKASSPSIQMLWYITPAAAMVWLYAFGISEITYLIGAGAGLIIFGNILAALPKKQKPS